MSSASRACIASGSDRHHSRITPWSNSHLVLGETHITENNRHPTYDWLTVQGEQRRIAPRICESLKRAPRQSDSRKSFYHDKRSASTSTDPHTPPALCFPRLTLGPWRRVASIRYRESMPTQFPAAPHPSSDQSTCNRERPSQGRRIFLWLSLQRPSSNFVSDFLSRPCPGIILRFMNTAKVILGNPGLFECVGSTEGGHVPSILVWSANIINVEHSADCRISTMIVMIFKCFLT